MKFILYGPYDASFLLIQVEHSEKKVRKKRKKKDGKGNYGQSHT